MKSIALLTKVAISGWPATAAKAIGSIASLAEFVDLLEYEH
jgi:hypothetical protein